MFPILILQDIFRQRYLYDPRPQSCRPPQAWEGEAEFPTSRSAKVGLVSRMGGSDDGKKERQTSTLVAMTSTLIAMASTPVAMKKEQFTC